MDLPFDGAISAYYKNEAPDPIRKAIKRAEKDDILGESYPHSERMSGKRYDKEMARLQIELVKLQAWARETGTRIAMVFEGRDAAGKGGTIRRFIEHMNPRSARVVALPAVDRARQRVDALRPALKRGGLTHARPPIGRRRTGVELGKKPGVRGRPRGKVHLRVAAAREPGDEDGEA